MERGGFFLNSSNSILANEAKLFGNADLLRRQ
jgi:hypothetical protein